MERCFNELIDKVSRIEQLETEREELKQDRAKLLNEANDVFSAVFEKYNSEEQQLDMMLNEAEAENQRNKKAIVSLTKEEVMALSNGVEFAHGEQLAKLKAEVATYQQKVDALEQLKREVCISSRDDDMLHEYYVRGKDINNKISMIGNDLQLIIADVRDRILLNCLASFERIPGREEFARDLFDKLRHMRKEERIS